MPGRGVSQVPEEPTQHRGRRGHDGVGAREEPIQVDARENATRCRLGVAFYPRELPGEDEVGSGMR